jgi:hypothetical protein
MILCSGGNHSPWSAITVRTLPRAPSARSCRIASNFGKNALQRASIRNTPLRRAASLSFGCVERQRLLYEDVLASFNCGESIGEVPGVDGGDVDDVDLGVGHHIVPGEALRNAGLFGERFSPRRIARLYCVLLKGRDKPLGDQPGPQIPQRSRGTRVGSRILARGRIFGNGIGRLFTRTILSNAKEETSTARPNAVYLQLPRLELPCAGQAAALSSPASCAIALRAFSPMFW